ncbi:D-2-hydroxyacid dehydrogenase [Halomonas ventosae]|uniref:Phosphoglycerate dehydrogenase-like enzyme n=1 Tax=Halomonas ventosae TaxID=229007 RepID=A0A2T0VB36_9GAMM|nr:D-2-hydroxyacid dehydrogenase [Halomonas ventosae]PRY67364.1 phosphoglycerate dehydrogenase-like enzyme [Halomonas ventosae]
MPMETLLVLQHEAVLARQREALLAQLAEGLPEARVVLASHPGEVPEGLRVDAVITPTLPWLPEALSRLGAYAWIHFLSSGVETIWAMPFDKRRVLMTRSAGVHAPAMSEFALGAMLYFAKRLGRWTRQSATPHWRREWLGELTDARLTILGMGRVGSLLAERARVFGMQVQGLRRHAEHATPGVTPLTRTRLPEVLADTDYLVVCLPLTDETRGLVDDGLLESLRPGAVLVDISRGGVVGETAVIKALETGRLSGAALDVFEHEPLPAGSRLWGREDVLLTPHVSGTTPFYLERAVALFLDNHRALAAGQAPLTPVDVEAGY